MFNSDPPNPETVVQPKFDRMKLESRQENEIITSAEYTTCLNDIK